MSEHLVDHLRIFFPTRFKVCGQFLKPLSIGHLLTFERYGLGYRLSNPDITEEKRYWNFVTAFMLCTRDWQENQVLWTQNVEQPDVWKEIYNKTSDDMECFDLEIEYPKFLDYLKFHLKNFPQTHFDADQEKIVQPEKERGSPYLLSIITSLLTTFDSSVSKMFNVENPLDIIYDGASWILTVRQEQQGLTNIDTVFDGDDGKVLLQNLDKLSSIKDDKERYKAFMEMDLNKEN